MTDDIYKADEFGLLYPVLIVKILHLKCTKCSGDKLSKIRLTGMAAASANDEKFLTFVIIKIRNKSSCFKDVKKLSCRYEGIKKRWIDSAHSQKYVRELENQFDRVHIKSYEIFSLISPGFPGNFPEILPDNILIFSETFLWEPPLNHNLGGLFRGSFWGGGGGVKITPLSKTC